MVDGSDSPPRAATSLPPLPARQPDPEGKPAKGGRAKERLFAALILRKVPLTEAFIRAGFPVVGARGPSGQVWEEGWSPEGAARRAAQLAGSARVQGYIAFWGLPIDQQLRALAPDALDVYRRGLAQRKGDGTPTSLAVQCADSIMDRIGHGRSSKVQKESVPSDSGRRIEQLEKEIAEAIEYRRAAGIIDADIELLPEPVEGGEPDGR